MAEGTIKFFSTKKGFGFIRVSDRREIFFHVSNVCEGVDETLLQEDTQVEFDIEESDDRGPQAVNVQVTN